MNTNSKRLSEKLVIPFTKFAEIEASSGILLLICTTIALIWANSPWAHAYHHLWEITVTAGIGPAILSKPLHYWINDGLMAIFFFLVGLEIKREVLIGELASLKKSLLPIIAALGGMVVPALIYFSFNRGLDSAGGWGIPMATDIAFALGVLTLLGNRVPVTLKIFLMALAIIDDIGAILVIAFFYTSQLSVIYLIGGFFCLGAMFVCNFIGVRNPLVYALFGIPGLWLCFLLSGVHATIAGVLAAFAIPASTRINSRQFGEVSQSLIDEFKASSEMGEEALTNQNQQTTIHQLEKSCEQVQTPMQRLEHGLHLWVNYLILPLFALANAGVTLQNLDWAAVLHHPVILGVLSGLFLGKPLGIFLFSMLAIKVGLASMPEGVNAKQIFGAGILGGIGFTMSIFIAGLAFTNADLLTLSKLAILIASLLSGLLGYFFLKKTT